MPSIEGNTEVWMALNLAVLKQHHQLLIPLTQIEAVVIVCKRRHIQRREAYKVIMRMNKPTRGNSSASRVDHERPIVLACYAAFYGARRFHVCPQNTNRCFSQPCKRVEGGNIEDLSPSSAATVGGKPVVCVLPYLDATVVVNVGYSCVQRVPGVYNSVTSTHACSWHANTVLDPMHRARRSVKRVDEPSGPVDREERHHVYPDRK